MRTTISNNNFKCIIQLAYMICCIPSVQALMGSITTKRTGPGVRIQTGHILRATSIPFPVLNEAIKEPVISTLSKSLFSPGHLSFGDAVSSPIALALHSGRFVLLQRAIWKIPG